MNLFPGGRFWTRLGALLAFALPSGLAAQPTTGSTRALPLPRYNTGIGLVYAKPRGEFGDNIKEGWGGNLFGVIYTSPGSPIGIRFEGQWIVYGERTRDFRYSGGFGGYTLQETTSNNILALTIGPQFAINGGPFQPYVNIRGGTTYFSTTTNFSAQDVTVGFQPFVPTGATYASDWKLTYGAGAGVNIPVTRGQNQMMIDFGVTYDINGQTTYLTKDDVHRDPNTGIVTLTPRRSDAHYLTYRLGVTISFASFPTIDY